MTSHSISVLRRHKCHNNLSGTFFFATHMHRNYQTAQYPHDILDVTDALSYPK